MDFKELYSENEGIIIHKVSTLSRDIEYKKLDPERFSVRGFDVESTQIQSEKNKYISDQLSKKVDLDCRNTTIISAGVGEGKTTASYKLIEKCVKKGFKVINASPFIALTERDKEALAEYDVSITHYHDIGTRDSKELIKNDVQIITINSLLGNPGDYEQRSTVKEDYLITLREYCESHNQKVVFFFDEIHSGVENFLSKFRNELFKWEKLTHKCLIFSATYTEASYPVLGFISELTSKQVCLIDFPRKTREDTADLHLLFTDRRYSKGNLSALNILAPVIEKAVSNDRTINILTATKSIAKELVNQQRNEKVAKYLAGQNPNLLTSETSSENKYEKNRLNIGTTFGTGFSINDEEALYVIILPAYLGVMENIFANGRSAIIQAVARQRRKGDIVIVSTVPKGLIEGDYLKHWPDDLMPEYKTPYLQLSEQRGLIKKEYEKRKSLLEESLDISGYKIELNGMDFQMIEGQKILAKKEPIFGKSVAPFVIWAAMNNQFSNAKLKSIIYVEPSWNKYVEKKYKVSSDNIFPKLDTLVSDDISKYITEMSDWEAYEEVIEDIKMKGASSQSLTFSTKKTKLERNTIVYNGTELSHDQLIRHPKIGRWALRKLYSLRGGATESYTLQMYINDQIYHADQIHNSEKSFGLKHPELLAAYLRLNRIKKGLRILADDNNGILEADMLDMDTLTEVCKAHYFLKDYDHFIKNDIFSFLRPINNKYRITSGKKIIIDIKNTKFKKKVFKQLVKALLQTKSKKVPDGKGGRKRVKKVISFNSPSDESLNFLI